MTQLVMCIAKATQYARITQPGHLSMVRAINGRKFRDCTRHSVMH